MQSIVLKPDVNTSNLISSISDTTSLVEEVKSMNNKSDIDNQETKSSGGSQGLISD